jgi:hypothetical protein
MSVKTKHNQILRISCAFVAVLSVVCTLGFMRAHYFNATNAGWGDADQDRHQWLLGWGTRISAAIALICIVIWVAISRRALISIATGAALSGLLVLAAHGFPIIYATLALPGFFTAMYTFGVHAGGQEVIAYMFIVNAIIYSEIAFLLIRKKISR